MKYSIFLAMSLTSCTHIPKQADDSLVIDHILYAGPSLKKLSNEIESKAGVAPAPGGQHPDLGTHNATISMQDESYLELIAPDPSNPLPGGVKVLGIGQLKSPKLVAWAARVKDFDALYKKFSRSGIKVTPILNGSRKADSGELSTWRYFYVTDERFGEVPRLIPFFIDYGNHARSSSTAACHLASLKGSHPQPEKFVEFSKIVDLKMNIQSGHEVKLNIALDCPKGAVLLQ